eukprot:1714051-Amphidinium_carterae.1
MQGCGWWTRTSLVESLGRPRTQSILLAHLLALQTPQAASTEDSLGVDMAQEGSKSWHALH